VIGRDEQAMSKTTIPLPSENNYAFYLLGKAPFPVGISQSAISHEALEQDRQGKKGASYSRNSQRGKKVGTGKRSEEAKESPKGSPLEGGAL